MKCTIQYKTKQNDTPPFLTYFAAGHTTLRMTAKSFFISILQTFCNQLPIEPVQPPCPWLVGEPSNGMCENKLGFCLNWCPASLPRSYDTQNPKNKFHSSTKTIQHRRVSVLFLHFGLFKSISFSWRQGETGSDPPPMVGTKSNFSSDPVWWLPDLDLTKTLQHWTNFVKLDQANQALLRRVLERPSPHLPRLLPRSTEKMILSGNLGNAQKNLICFSWGHP